MFITEFYSDANFGLAYITLLVYWTINYSDNLQSDILQIVTETGPIGLRLSYNNNYYYLNFYWYDKNCTLHIDLIYSIIYKLN